MRLSLVIFGLVAFCHAVTLPNQPLKFDTKGSLIDAHDGKIYSYADKYYLYGVSYGCGFRWRTSHFASPFCGFKAYSSTDLLTWSDEGFLFDAQTEYWQNLCADTAACFRPKVVHDSSRDKYILWMNSGSTTWSYTVLESSHPAGPFVEVNKPVMPFARGNTSYGNGDFGIHISAETGEGYIAYDTTPFVTGPPRLSPENITYGVVQRLTPNYTAVEPEYVVTDLANVEAFDIWYRKGWWYLTFGHICGYCDSTDTSYIKSPNPLGPFRAENRMRITNSSCGGQHNSIAQLPSSEEHKHKTGEESVWLYGSDLWTGEVNEGKAGSHWEPLQFTNTGDMRPLKCYEESYDVPISTKPTTEVDVFANATVSSGAGNYTWSCDLGTQDKNLLYQFFQAPRSGLVREIGVNIAQKHNDAPLTLYFGSVVDVSLLYTPEGGVNNTWSSSYNVSEISWAMGMVVGQPNVTVHEASQWALQLIAFSIIKGAYYAIYATTTGGMVPYCYLMKSNGNSDNLGNGFDTGVLDDPPTSFLSEIQQGRYPLYPLLGKEMRYYVRID